MWQRTSCCLLASLPKIHLNNKCFITLGIVTVAILKPLWDIIAVLEEAYIDELKAHKCLLAGCAVPSG